MFNIRFIFSGTPPDIDEGPFIPLPPTVQFRHIVVQIGSPAYLIDGLTVSPFCDILSGTRPITISWFRNGVLDPTKRNASFITVSNYNDGDVFTCRADNHIGFDMESTTINVFGK